MPPKPAARGSDRFVPVIVTVSPVPADAGVNEEIVGGGITLLLSIEKLSPLLTTRSGFPSPSRSPVVMLTGYLPVA